MVALSSVRRASAAWLSSKAGDLEPWREEGRSVSISNTTTSHAAHSAHDSPLRPARARRRSEEPAPLHWHHDDPPVYAKRPDLALQQRRAVTMPLQKARDNQPNPSKPLMPTLASARTVKTPITPRLATQHASATPPLAKVPRSSTPNTIKSPPAREDLSTPAKAFIDRNVTPRSSSRKSRVDSNFSTPTSTPTASHPSSHVDGINNGSRQTPFAGLGLGILGSGNKSRPVSMVGGAQEATSPGIATQPKFFRGDEAGTGSMFFHASDVRRSPELRPAAVPTRKSPVFFYANGQQDETARPASQPSPPLSSVSTRSKKSQFFRADGRADDDVPPVPSLPSPPAHSTPPQFFQAASAFRPPSPQKDASFHLSYRKGASQIIRPSERPKTISILPPTIEDVRKDSIGSVALKSRSHKRTSSLSSIESGSSARKPSGTALDGTGLTPLQTIVQAQNLSFSGPASPTAIAPIPSPILENAPFSESTSSLPAMEQQSSPSSPLLSIPQSPTKSSGAWQTQLAETINNARVERKIQDLEISNSSLMAINKSLEKEVRRQNKELRRFRRLSRAGRLSTVSTIGSLGTVGEDEELYSQGGELSALDELSEDDEDEDEAEESSDDSSSNDEGGSLSPSAIAEREERKLAKDSKRLQLDLAKHREILVDSQKLNQSLKRCMAWTELMIKDGRKALDYKAEAELGGRILDHDDLTERLHDDEDDEDQAHEDGPRHSLLSSWTPSPMPILEKLDGILGVDTSEITRKSWQSQEGASSEVEAPDSLPSKPLLDGDFWSVAAALP